MEYLVADLGMRPLAVRFPGPGIVGGFIDVVLEFVECLRGDPGNAVHVSLAVGVEVVPHVRARPAHLVVTGLARKSALTPLSDLGRSCSLIFLTGGGV
jgi:hypothetical protein